MGISLEQSSFRSSNLEISKYYVIYTYNKTDGGQILYNEGIL